METIWSQSLTSRGMLETVSSRQSLLCVLSHSVTQSCPTLCKPMDCRPSGSSVHGDSPGKNIGVGCHALLQGIFPTEGLNPDLPHCRWILCHLSHQGSPRISEWVAYAFSRGSSRPRNWTRVSLPADSLPTEPPGKLRWTKYRGEIQWYIC